MGLGPAWFRRLADVDFRSAICGFRVWGMAFSFLIAFYIQWLGCNIWVLVAIELWRLVLVVMEFRDGKFRV